MAVKQPSSTAPTNLTAFRRAERFWKAPSSVEQLSRAFTVEAVSWDEAGEGTWEGTLIREDGEEEARTLHLQKVRLDQDVLGKCTGWKGKEKEAEGGEVFGLQIIEAPGLVILPSLLSPSFQRRLILEGLRSASEPNLTSLSPHFDVPASGLWAAHEAGHSKERVPGKVYIPPPHERATKDGQAPRRQRVDWAPVNKENWKEQLGRGQPKEPVVHVEEDAQEEHKAPKDASVAELIARMRWVTIGWSYDWTSKTYDFGRPKVALPPLIYQACRDIVQSVPWEQLYGGGAPAEDTEDEKNDWKCWKTDYEPEAGVVNFYQLKDSLTAHQDQSELDAVRPLVSLSLGHAAIFLVGGQTRDTPPLPLLLRSGDGVLMSGPEGRRVFHGIPKVLAGTLPAYLGPDAALDGAQDVGEDEWRRCGEYLAQGARLNVNVRQVGVDGDLL